jgi:hypothetical protein
MTPSPNASTGSGPCREVHTTYPRWPAAIRTCGRSSACSRCLGASVPWSSLGYWAYLLREMNTDIIAFDQAPPGGSRTNRYHPDTSTWTEVLEADQTVLTAHRERALFVCWPPLFSSLGDCLTFYPGDTVAWLGDDGFRTARPQGLREEFRQLAVYPARAVEPFPGVPATLSLWRRRDRRPSQAPSTESD